MGPACGTTPAAVCRRKVGERTRSQRGSHDSLFSPGAPRHQDALGLCSRRLRVWVLRPFYLRAPAPHLPAEVRRSGK